MKKLIYLLFFSLSVISGTQAQNINAVEYFIDTDPGQGNGIVLTINTPGTDITFTATIPTVSLSNGFHLVTIRARDENGKWGLFESRGFYISALPTNAGSITAAEYFFDTDPGPGNATAIIVSSGNNVPFSVILPTITLAAGFHLLAIRTKDENGKWGLFEQRGFYINPAPVDMPVITAAEYFFDADPGVGNGTAVTINTPGITVTQNCVLTIPLSISQGQHLSVLRVRDVTGHWGLFEMGTITVVGNPLPLTLLSFSGQRQNQYVLLHWQTENETNTSHFEIERSSNGATFEKINTVNAKNIAGRNEYSFTDNSIWNTDTRFYRLKMVDIDGHFKFSNIIKLSNKAGALLSVFPNPATDAITISGLTGKGEMRLYNIEGKELIKRIVTAHSEVIDMSLLAKGMYLLKVTDADNVRLVQIIKQ